MYFISAIFIRHFSKQDTIKKSMDTEVKRSFYNHIYHLAERSYYETFLPLDKISELKKCFVNYMK